MNRIILLGASGFIGSALLNKLHNEQFDVLPIGHSNALENNSEKINVDITKEGIFDSILEKDDIVVNTIGQISKDTQKFIDSNIIGNINLLNSCSKKKIEKIIFLSTINVYGENTGTPSKETDKLKPSNLYSLTKFLAETLYRLYNQKDGINVTILRLANLYGPDKTNGLIGNLIQSLVNENKVLIHHDGNQIRDLLYIEDAIEGIMKAIVKTQKGIDIFNISSGNEIKIKNLISLIEKISSKKLDVEYTSEVPDEKYLCADNLHAKTELGFSTTSFEEGLKKTIKQISEKSST